MITVCLIYLEMIAIFNNEGLILNAQPTTFFLRLLELKKIELERHATIFIQ